MIWVKTFFYLVMFSITISPGSNQPRREYSPVEKALLTELCITVTLDVLQSDKITKGEPCFFAHGDHQGNLIPFRSSILKRIKKQGINAYPSTAMIGKGELDFITRQRAQQKPQFVLEGTTREGRLYIIKFKSYKEDTVRFNTSRLKRNQELSVRRYQLKKTGGVWKIDSMMHVIF